MSKVGCRRIELSRVAWWLAIGLLLVSAASSRSAGAVAPAQRFATVIELSGPIGPAMSRFVEHSLTNADNEHSTIVILRMDTPGGLDTSMRDIIKAILASPVPVVTYVAPGGARAASAGTYILYASHLAAMAPATNLGAATPISIGGEPSTPPAVVPVIPGDDKDRGADKDTGGTDRDIRGADKDTGGTDRDIRGADKDTRGTEKSNPGGDKDNRSGDKSNAGADKDTRGTDKSTARGDKGNRSGDKKQKSPEDIALGTASERKAVNDAVAYIRALAQLRGRNTEWAEAAVRGAASLSADDALEQHVIDIVAKDVPDLLQQLQGRKVKAADREIMLDTRGLAVRNVAPDWRTRVLLVLTHPTIAYGLLLIGIYGLLLEGYNPGAVLPGVVGALSLLLGLYGLQLLAVNYAGLALMALGIGLIVTEFFMPAFGSLGVGGLAAFVIGSIILFDNQASGLRMALPLIVGIAVAGGLVIFIIGWLAAGARRRPVCTGVETMIGASVEAVSDCQDRCVVRYGGELWNARTASPLREGQQARIVKVVELTLWVEPQQN